MTPQPPMLEARNVVVGLVRGEPVRLVDDVSLSVHAGEAVGLVGESGSGKSLTLRAMLGLLPSGVAVTSGTIAFAGEQLSAAAPNALRRLRGRRMSMIFQDPMTALNPVMTVADQIAEGPSVHLGLHRRAARRRAVELMQQVGIPDAARRAGDYPHEFSGGMRQRVMIAIALSCSPSLLLCDEPTTALDVTTQHQILQLIDELRETTGIAVLFVTHDLAVVAQLCDRVMVMYAGQIIESGTTWDVFSAPRHAYTLGLLRSAPDLVIRRDRLGSIAGMPPDPARLPPGCRFAPRCEFADDTCRRDGPLPLHPVGAGHHSACVHHRRVEAAVHAEPVISDV